MLRLQQWLVSLKLQNLAFKLSRLLSLFLGLFINIKLLLNLSLVFTAKVLVNLLEIRGLFSE